MTNPDNPEAERRDVAAGSVERPESSDMRLRKHDPQEVRRLHDRIEEQAIELLELRARSERRMCAYCAFGETEDVSMDALQWHIEKECGTHPIARLIAERDAARAALRWLAERYIDCGGTLGREGYTRYGSGITDAEWAEHVAPALGAPLVTP